VNVHGPVEGIDVFAPDAIVRDAGATRPEMDGDTGRLTMNHALSSKVQGFSTWFWFALMLACAVIADISAVRTPDFGMAISGIGFTFLAAFSLFCPLSLTADVRTMFRPMGPLDPRAAVLGGLGVALNALGLAIRWLG
jgi:hypothetical protein